LFGIDGLDLISAFFDMGKRMRMLGLALRFLLPLALVAPLWAADVKIIHNKGELDYHIKIIKAAMEHTREMGAYELRPSDATFGTARLIEEIADNTGNVHVMSRAPAMSEKALEKLLPIRIPLEKGLLGYRVMIVRKQDLPKLAAINSLEELKKLSLGQGSRWVDADVLAKGGFNVVRGYYPAGLLRMLNEERFDVFPRAIWEAPKEVDDASKDIPDLTVEPTLVLRYPFARYFWVSQKGDGPELAKRLETGLRRMIADGTFDRLFNEFFGPFIESSNLRGRKLFEIDNALLPPDTPLDDLSLWFSMKAEDAILSKSEKK
jgi:hypothetical protein